MPVIKKFVNLFVPKDGTKEYRELKEKMKAAATKDKMEWIYINRLALCILVFIVSVLLIGQLHRITINNIYTDTTVTYNIIGEMD